MYARKDNVFASLAPTPTDADLLRLRCDSQSLSYYGDISRFLSARLMAFETLSLLDVGPRTGVGLALLRLLHHPAAFTRLKFDPVVGIDLDPSFEVIAQGEFPDVQGKTGDIFDLPPKSYDIVTCSHTIEHIYEMEVFVAQLEQIARRGVVLACPFEEREPRSDGHVQRIDAARLAAMSYHDVEVYDSFHFHNGACCLAYKPLA
jgi:2-polyprenyl-3-methyl-5-hydroxy-6-metoxy-1,4-benzoquinol methylase